MIVNKIMNKEMRLSLSKCFQYRLRWKGGRKQRNVFVIQCKLLSTRSMSGLGATLRVDDGKLARCQRAPESSTIAFLKRTPPEIDHMIFILAMARQQSHSKERFSVKNKTIQKHHAKFLIYNKRKTYSTRRFTSKKHSKFHNYRYCLNCTYQA